MKTSPPIISGSAKGNINYILIEILVNCLYLTEIYNNNLNGADEREINNSPILTKSSLKQSLSATSSSSLSPYKFK